MFLFKMLTEKSVKRLLTALVMAAAVVPASAQTTENSMLWKIEGDGIKDAYLFGTIHLLPQSEFELKQRVIDALDDSKVLVLEIDMSDPAMQGKMMQKAPMKGGETLDNLLDESTLQELDKMLQESIGANVAFMNGWKPFIVSSFLIGRLIEGQPASFELSLVQAAKKREMPVMAMETLEDQMAIFDRVPYQSQADDLAEMVNEEPKIKKLYAEMVAAYKAENLDKLYKMLTEYMDDPKERDMLLGERNRKWVPLFSDMAAGQEIFVGVGAGHLPGDDGMIALLRKAGYTVTAVKE